MAHWINFRAAVGVGALIWSIAAVACVALKTWHGASAASNLITGALVCAMASLVFIRSPAIADSDREILGGVLHGRESKILKLIGILSPSKNII